MTEQKKRRPLTASDVVRLRKQFGLNQAEFWGAIGVTQSGGSRYESGRRFPLPVRILLDCVYRGNALPRVSKPAGKSTPQKKTPR